jgi:hypothetical protein
MLHPQRSTADTAVVTYDRLKPSKGDKRKNAGSEHSDYRLDERPARHRKLENRTLSLGSAHNGILTFVYSINDRGKCSRRTIQFVTTLRFFLVSVSIRPNAFLSHRREWRRENNGAQVDRGGVGGKDCRM